MNTIKLLLTMLVLSLSVSSADENSKSLPDVTVKDMKGTQVNIKNLSNDGKPMIINFWATWCKPCLQELDEINKKYDIWQKETGVKVVAVSLDDSRSSKKVAPLVKARNWKYEILIDENSDMKRTMNVSNPPHTFLIDGNGKIVYEHNGYSLGSEDELYEKIKELTGKK